MAAIEAGKEIIRTRDFISELGMRQEQFRLHYDNQSTTLEQSISRGEYHWLRERVEERDFSLMKIHMDANG